MSKTPAFAAKLSEAESVMWRLELDPYLSSTFFNVTLLDRPADFGRFRRRLERASYLVRRLRQRVQPALANLSTPTWVDDPNFDIDYHVRHIGLPQPGTMRQLLDLGSLLASDPFDRTRPLWQFYIVDGLADGGGALIQKMHHSIADGEASLAISLQFLDFERSAAEPPPIDPQLIKDLPSDPSANNIVRDVLVGSLRGPLSLAKTLNKVATTTKSPSAAGQALGGLRDAVDQLKDPKGSNSTLWTERSLRRRLEVLRLPFAPVKEAATTLGGTVNTAFLTGAAHAAGEYHRRHGAPVDSLVATMAISTRTKESGGNAFSVARFHVPTGEMSMAARFAAVGQATSQARSAGGPNLDALSGVLATIPVSVIAKVARQQTQSTDFATSNVRAAPMELYVAGGKILANYPAGPLLGVAFNLTMLTYAGSMDMGLNIDPAAVAEPESLRECLDDAFAELVDAAKPRRAATRASSGRRRAASAVSGRPTRRR